MPLYRFKCKTCSIEFNKLCSGKARKNVVCECGSRDLKFLLGRVSDDVVVMECGDSYKGTQVRRGVREVIEKRSKDDLKNNIGKIVETKGKDVAKNLSVFKKNGSLKTSWDR